MAKKTSSRSKTKTTLWVWVMLAVAVSFLALAGCVLLVVGLGFFWPEAAQQETATLELATETLAIPPALNETPLPTDATPQPTETFIVVETATETAPGEGGEVISLNASAEPLYGTISLQAGFSPDPFTADVRAGGMVDPAEMGLACFFTTSQPTFTFTLSGGASDTFLRIYFIPDDDVDTSLVLLTPNQEWFCVDDSPYNLNPMIDLAFASRGKYAIWLGMVPGGSYGDGTLYITQSVDNTP